MMMMIMMMMMMIMINDDDELLHACIPVGIHTQDWRDPNAPAICCISALLVLPLVGLPHNQTLKRKTKS